MRQPQPLWQSAPPGSRRVKALGWLGYLMDSQNEIQKLPYVDSFDNHFTSEIFNAEKKKKLDSHLMSNMLQHRNSTKVNPVAVIVHVTILAPTADNRETQAT